MAFLLAALFAPAAQAQTPLPAQPALAMTARGGFGDDGSYLIGEWFPVRVTLVNPPGARSLRVRVEVDSEGPNGDAVGSYGRDVDLPAQSRKEVTLYVYAAGFTRSLEVRVVQGSTVIGKQQISLSPLEQPAMLVGVASSDGSLLNVLRGEKAGHVPTAFGTAYGGPPLPASNGPVVTIAHVSLGDIPPQSVALNSLGALVLDDVDTSKLSSEQLRSISAWVARGGTLIVVARPGGADISPDIASLLPVTIRGTTGLTSLDGLAGLVETPITPTGPVVATNATLRPEPAAGARLLASQDGVPLVAMRDLGAGQVAYLALSPGVAPLKNWDGLVPLFKRLLVEHRLGPSPGAAINTQGGYNFAPYGPGQSTAPFEIYSDIFELPGLELPDPLIITLFLLVYIVIIGPVNFIILRRMRRPEIAWATIPALVLLFSVAAYILGYGSKGGDIVTIRAKVAHSAPELQDTQAMELWGVFAPNRGNYRLSVNTDSVVSQFNSYGGGGPNSQDFARVSAGGGATSVDNVLINTGSLKGFAVENTLKAQSPLVADLSVGDNLIVGTLRNRSGGGLQDVALARGDAVQYIGYLAPGGSAQVELQVSPGSFGSPSPSLFVATPPGVAVPSSGSYYGGPSGSAEQRKFNRKVHLLNAGLGPLVSDDPPTNMDVIALAWGADMPVNLSVDGHFDRSEDLSLWTTTLHVTSAEGAKPHLKTGLVPSYLYVPSNDPAWLPKLPNGRQTLDPFADVLFRLPAGTKPNSLNLSIKLASSPGNVDVLAYNVNKGQWDRLGGLGSSSQATNFVTPIPNPSDYTGPAGDVTVRLKSTSGKADLEINSVDLGLNEPSMP